MKASDWIASYLADRGIDRVFEMIGGMTTHLLDSIYREGRSSIVTVHHEQAGAMAACGWAQVKGLPGVALATSGPGAVNLLTGVGTCYFDSVPAIFITGQVNRNELSTGRPMRQLGFQETDVVSMAKAITKGSVQVTDPEDIPRIMDWAFKTSMEGRPG
ncbi:MAG: thiamine pyrophosphate-binding protein, partial [Synergistales bacterium]|nr:thiamine pyrophosphate-binding protein [Synergistales bacterium]